MSVAACSEFGCDGCVNRDGMAGISKGCAWCQTAGAAPGIGDCVPMAMAALCKSGNTLTTDTAVCSTRLSGATTSSSGNGDEATVVCSSEAVGVCRTQCPNQELLACDCFASASRAPSSVCKDSGLAPGAVAGIAVATVFVVVCLVGLGLVYYMAKPADAVVDKNGKRQEGQAAAPARAGGADGNAMLSQRAAAVQSGNPGPDGLWYCLVSGDPNCNRAYMSGEELNTHILKRHPHSAQLPLPRVVLTTSQSQPERAPSAQVQYQSWAPSASASSEPRPLAKNEHYDSLSQTEAFG